MKSCNKTLFYYCVLPCISLTIFISLTFFQNHGSLLPLMHIEFPHSSHFQALCSNTSHIYSNETLSQIYKRHMNCNQSHPGTSLNYNATHRQFYVPAYFNEQLGKATLHLAEAVLIGKSLDRTLVLPRVGKSEIGINYLNPFCTYFDPSSLNRETPWISYEQLSQELARENGGGLTGVIVLFSDPQSSCQSNMDTILSHGYLRARDGVSDDIVRAMHRIARVNVTSQFVCYNGSALLSPDERALFAGNVESALATLKNVNVVFFVKLNFYALHSSNPDIPDLRDLLYTSHPRALESLVEAFIRTDLGGPDYLAIQWRTEKCFQYEACDEQRFRKCSEAGIAKARSMVVRYNLRNVFLATDWDFGHGMKSNSMYLEPLKREWVGKALDVFQKELRPVMFETKYPIAYEFEAGVRGIIDRMLCVRAGRFLAAAEGCGGGSSFMYAVEIERAKWNMWELAGPV